ncbi:endopolygalacturonase [filamentous cyanobacterium CCT1]|nr:endopolygalacturonase [filamentous cyanobacterium CCT1]PSN81599.1 endopolygalacturonase [filamentous cyanobacterium CCP4]
MFFNHLYAFHDRLINGNYYIPCQLYSPSFVDLILPTATATAANLTTARAGGTTYDFIVTYTDNVAVNTSTLDSSDVQVTGPNEFNQFASLVSVNTSGNGTPRTATYRITAPGSTWDTTDNGTYTLALQKNQVSDNSNNFIAASTLGTFSVDLPAFPPSTSENIVFPAGAGVLNVKDFGAKGDGVTDDTAAIQAALNAYPNGKRIIYLPNGTYLISNTLTWPAGTPGTGNEYKNTILQGQSENGAVIKLNNNSAIFSDQNNPKAVIFTGPAPAQRFGNSIRNLTVDTGTGNPGAIGVQFNASNQGSMRQITIRSGDGQGVHGLDMSFANEIGPLLIKGVTVDGFQYGIRTGFSVNSQTLEDITLQNQSVYGFYNTGQIINIRGLTSNNDVTAIYNAGGRVTVLDSTLNGLGQASTQPAIRSDFPLDLVVRNIATSGYGAAIQNAGTTIAGPVILEFVSGGIQNLFQSPGQTLNLPIKETPDVPWDDPTTNPWANVISYGAIPNDGLDDTAAIQAAIDSGKTTVYLPVGNYDLQNTVFVRNNTRRIIGTEAYIEINNTVNPGFKVIDGTNPVVVIERIQTGFNSTPTFENASSRTLVVRDSTNVSGNMTGSGDVFLENVVSNPLQNWTFDKQNVWARQFNVENQGTHIINNGGNLWIFGLKTERGGTLIDTRDGGKTELLGGLAYTTTSAPNGMQDNPMFINHESSISITLGEVSFLDDDLEYTTYVRETRDGVTRYLSGDSLTYYVGGGKHVPLYVGY